MENNVRKRETVQNQPISVDHIKTQTKTKERQPISVEYTTAQSQTRKEPNPISVEYTATKTKIKRGAAANQRRVFSKQTQPARDLKPRLGKEFILFPLIY